MADKIIENTELDNGCGGMVRGITSVVALLGTVMLFKMKETDKEALV